MTEITIKNEIKELLKHIHIDEMIANEIKAKLFDLVDQNVIKQVIKDFLQDTNIQSIIYDTLKKEINNLVQIKVSDVAQSELTLNNIEFSNIVYDSLLCSDHIKRILESPINAFLDTNLSSITKEVVKQQINKIEY